MGLSSRIVTVPDGPLDRIWSAECDSPTKFSSLAAVGPGVGFARMGRRWVMHLRGPATKATPAICPADSEYFGADFRLGAYLPMFPPSGLIDFQDAVLPTLPDGRILLDGRAWEMPTPQNLDVFFDRLERAGLIVYDPMIDDLRHDVAVPGLPERTAQSRFVRAVGVPRRTLQLIERARHAADLLRAGSPIADVVAEAGYYDQPHLTRALRRLIGHTPAEVARGSVVLGL